MSCLTCSIILVAARVMRAAAAQGTVWFSCHLVKAGVNLKSYCWVRTLAAVRARFVPSKGKVAQELTMPWRDELHHHVQCSPLLPGFFGTVCTVARLGQRRWTSSLAQAGRGGGWKRTDRKLDKPRRPLRAPQRSKRRAPFCSSLGWSKRLKPGADPLQQFASSRRVKAQVQRTE